MSDAPRYRLINARPSPFGRKVAIALREKGLDYDVTYDVPWAPDTCTPEYSPFQQLPILITPTGENICESSYILDWIEAKHPVPPLLPAETDARLEAKHRQMMGERFIEFAGQLIFEHHRPDPSQPWVERQSRKVEGGLKALDAIYAERRISDTMAIDLGDIAVATSVLLFDFIIPAGISPDIAQLRDWRTTAPRLADAADRLDQRPSFVATRPAMMDVDLKATVAA